uniref:Uncharacterized protein n=1 Tax=Arundo donax TaxID=35708 RepID=A0A0A9HHL6_ARUDO
MGRQEIWRWLHPREVARCTPHRLLPPESQASTSPPPPMGRFDSRPRCAGAAWFASSRCALSQAQPPPQSPVLRHAPKPKVLSWTPKTYRLPAGCFPMLGLGGATSGVGFVTRS